MSSTVPRNSKAHNVPPMTKRDPITGHREGCHGIVFIHGLSGSARSTWGPMIDQLGQDRDFDSFQFASYAFPTVKIRLPFTERMAKIQELSSALDTLIETDLSDCSEITLIGHSLGGLIARHYIISSILNNKKLLVKNLLMYAVPNTGASIASWASHVSIWHYHLKQLGKNSDIIDRINEDWVRMDVEKKISALYIASTGDKVVRSDSAFPFIGMQNTRTLNAFGHSDITQASSPQDVRYKILKKHLIGKFLPHSSGLSTALRSINTQPDRTQSGDPLFDIYDIADKPYYVVRSQDIYAKEVVSNNCLWVHGASGTGKTALLRHAILEKELKLIHMSLGGAGKIDATSALRYICVEFSELQGLDIIPPTEASTYDLVRYFKKAVLNSNSQIGLLIEEISFAPDNEAARFCEMIWLLSSSLSSNQDTNGRLVLTISSLHDPSADESAFSDKMKERVSTVEIGSWIEQDIRKLIDVIDRTRNDKLDNFSKNLIVDAANGSPRFVKLVFRQLQSTFAEGASFTDVLSRVSRENIR